MQPIIWLSIIAIVAATGLGMGFLAPTFSLVVQQVGAQHTNLVTPIKTAHVDFVIQNIPGVGINGNTVFKNRITQCSFSTPTQLNPGSTIICKLSDKDHDIVAEGRIGPTAHTLGSNQITYIPITVTANDLANEIQKVEDVKIIVMGPAPHAP